MYCFCAKLPKFASVSQSEPWTTNLSASPTQTSHQLYRMAYSLLHLLTDKFASTSTLSFFTILSH
jgi:hypothetical protein